MRVRHVLCIDIAGRIYRRIASERLSAVNVTPTLNMTIVVVPPVCVVMIEFVQPCGFDRVIVATVYIYICVIDMHVRVRHCRGRQQ